MIKIRFTPETMTVLTEALHHAYAMGFRRRVGHPCWFRS
jgi:hypothetical protein